MTTAVIVTTYNRPDALAAVLAGYLAQRDAEFELLIADDGSTEETRHVVEAYKARAMFPVVHVWHEDQGFRAAAIRNRALATTRADYIVFSDGDCVPPPRFVAQHRRLAEHGWFVAGNRVLLSERFTRRALGERLPLHSIGIGAWMGAWMKRDINRCLPLLMLPDGDFRKSAPQRWAGVKTCNLAAWRDDLLRVNGLDETYSGWGLEDSDLVIRLLRAGVKHKSARFAAPVFHLWHAENDRSGLPENQRRLAAVLDSNRVRAQSGLDQYRMTPPNSVLVVVTRRIGDVLLATPLIRSLSRAWPHTAIDVLVFDGTEGVLAANPDVRRVITIAERPRLGQHLSLLWRIARRYDVALSVVPSDRPTLYAWLAGRWRTGLVLEEPKHRWKTRLLHRWVPFDNLNTHTVLMHLALARTLAVAPCYEVIAASSEQDRSEFERQFPLSPSQPYVVLHMFPKFNYKMWRSAAWVEIARWLQAQGLHIVLSGGADSAELEYVGAIAREINGSINMAGRLTLSHAACMLAGARLYVGPDTALTHMAAALGVPVVALYGPGNPVKWGPWPAGYANATSPWRRHGTQRVNNVALIQGSGACVPCLNEGCDRHIASYSDCLQQLPSAKVIAAISDALAIGSADRNARSMPAQAR